MVLNRDCRLASACHCAAQFLATVCMKRLPSSGSRGGRETCLWMRSRCAICLCLSSGGNNLNFGPNLNDGWYSMTSPLVRVSHVESVRVLARSVGFTAAICLCCLAGGRAGNRMREPRRPIAHARESLLDLRLVPRAGSAWREARKDALGLAAMPTRRSCRRRLAAGEHELRSSAAPTDRPRPRRACRLCARSPVTVALRAPL